VLTIREAVENLTACDRPIGWTQHVTLGPPFLQKGVTEFRVSATRSKVFEQVFGAHDDLASGRVFDWPLAPRADGGTSDLRRYTNAPHSNAYTAHLMDQPARPRSSSPLRRRPAWRSRLEAARFSVARHLAGEPQPHARTVNGATLTCGMESGCRRCPSHAAR
jgi:hypothetical protein